MMNSSPQDSMPPLHPKSKQDNNEEEIDEVLDGVEVEEGQIMLRDPKTGGEVEDGQIVLRHPRTGELVPEEEPTTLEEKDGSDIEKEDIINDDDANDDEEDTTNDKKKDTIDEKDGSDIEMKDIVELVGACASGRPSRRSKINAEHKMAAAAVKKEESDDEDVDEDDDEDDDDDKDISGKDKDKEEEKDDTVVKKESEGINGDDDMVEDDDKSTSRKSRNKKRKQTKVKDSVKTEKDEDWEAVEEKPKKRARVSESVVKDSAEKMFAKLVKNYKDGITETPMDILASSITTKAGKPYKNHRSDAIQEGMKLLKAQGRAEKTKGNLGIMKVLTQLKFVEGKGKCSFTDKIFPHGRPNKGHKISM
ncbi:hypothetical protein FRACYDRAFT_243802 [Fragilariopsis cylindrus CCMP1102]|uniref:Uncharacterized protein n=1 Tax=Fragilariopsis cylindrus CCMP1102 TaxID=635003 RepID=A0A1E7F300_9STRA|nr:hypothetical protein FRACYDRAFT_243802 [Fragilariopsis cylindrus CCMP1102]|eukprot:OEU12550.1 hypothetical protein FRACYDRAFT_243802 [Fragilariopsis cylindrus CCMP1102]